MTELTRDDQSTFTPADLTRRSGQQDRTAAAGEPDAGAQRAGARRRRAREGSTVAVLSGATQRVGAAVSRSRAPGEGSRLWIEGAESPADLIDRVKEGPQDSADWPNWRVVGWKALVLLAVVPAVLGHAWAFAWGRPLRQLMTGALLVLLVVTLTAGPQTPEVGPAPGPAAGGER